MILYGKPVAEAIEEKIIVEIGKLKKIGVTPSLAVVLVGEDPASLIYVKKKEEKAESLGIEFKLYHLSEIASQNNILKLIDNLNKDQQIHGIIVQLPLPKDIDTEKILAAVSLQKDIESVPASPAGGSPAAQAILEILNYYNIDLKNKKIVIVGRGKLVGKPLEKILTAHGYEPLVCDSKTSDLSSKLLSADIIISGVGEPGLVMPGMVSKSAIVIDAGTAESFGKTVGDVSPEVYEKVYAYSPVPGGVGPVTVAMLYKNLIDTTALTSRTKTS